MHGAKVCIVDVQDKLGRDVSDTLGGEPNTCYFHCDVSKEDDVCRAVDFTVNKFGTLDIMVNNAGLSGSPCSDIRNADISDFEKIFDVNVKGVFLGMKHAARIMIPLKKGSIISLCSVASVIGGLGPHPYTGSKHAVLGLTKNVAAELGLHGIRVNCVSPYAVATGLALAHLPEDERTEDAMAGFRDFVGKNANLQGVELTVDDVANSVLFLASDEARYVSGANLMVDGGFTCTNHLLQKVDFDIMRLVLLDCSFLVAAIVDKASQAFENYVIRDILVRFMSKKVAESICETIGVVRRSLESTDDDGGNFIQYERYGRLKHYDKQCEFWIRSKSSLTFDKQQFGSYLRAAPYQTGGRMVILVPGYYGQVATTKKVSSEEGSPPVATVVGKPNTVTEDDKERINAIINSKCLVMAESRTEQVMKGINSHNIKNPDFSLPKKTELILIENDVLSTLIEINEGINSSSISRHPTTSDLKKMAESKKLAKTARLIETETNYYHKSSILDSTRPKIPGLSFKDNKSPSNPAGLVTCLKRR
ncbi:hypothetical protein CMV_011384 [Castanea mollissima]|uniref:Xanthoxin dehydrogenase n=1 Tax=Castanea mollissima TaxID=60419 RepID=A0A8J4R3C6_9ROSI|nr:hypothetical protein CMV_011384 [Castanea mollissima]